MGNILNQSEVKPELGKQPEQEDYQTLSSYIFCVSWEKLIQQKEIIAQPIPIYETTGKGIELSFWVLNPSQENSLQIHSFTYKGKEYKVGKEVEKSGYKEIKGKLGTEKWGKEGEVGEVVLSCQFLSGKQALGEPFSLPIAVRAEVLSPPMQPLNSDQPECTAAGDAPTQQPSLLHDTQGRPLQVQNENAKTETSQPIKQFDQANEQTQSQEKQSEELKGNQEDQGVAKKQQDTAKEGNVEKADGSTQGEERKREGQQASPKVSFVDGNLEADQRKQGTEKLETQVNQGKGDTKSSGVESAGSGKDQEASESKKPTKTSQQEEAEEGKVQEKEEIQMQEHLQQQQKQNDQLQKEKQDLQDDNEKLAKEVEELQTQIKELKGESTELKEEKQELGDNADVDWGEEREELLREVEELKEERAELGRQAEALSAENMGLVQKLFSCYPSPEDRSQHFQDQLVVLHCCWASVPRKELINQESTDYPVSRGYAQTFKHIVPSCSKCGKKLFLEDLLLIYRRNFKALNDIENYYV